MACFVELMKERQMMAQVTHEPELIRHLEEAPRTAYVGFDPTAESLHVGHLLPVLALRRWQQCGHRVVVLLGGGTAMVGDPTGKTEMRKVSNVEEIDARASRMVSQLSRLVDLSAPEKGVVVNNADWLRALEYLPFLREVGAHFSVNRMLTAECFKTRLERDYRFWNLTIWFCKVMIFCIYTKNMIVQCSLAAMISGRICLVAWTSFAERRVENLSALPCHF